MANTTNYNWETPDDTDLVKDGAAAIRTLGSSVDTTTKALNPSTTLGDIEYRSATANTNTRLGIGSSGQVLTVAGGVPTWATSDDANAIQNALLTTTGDTIYASGASTPARLGIGSTGQVLTVSGGVPTWASPAGGGGKVLQVVFASSTTVKSTTSTTYADTDITASITPSASTSKILVMVVHAAAGKNGDASNGLLQVKLMRNSTEISNSGDVFGNNNTANPNFSELTMVELDSPATTSAITYKTQYRSVNGGSGGAVINNYYSTSGQAKSTITLMEIGA